MNTRTIAFADFWPQHNPEADPLYELVRDQGYLTQKIDRADLTFYSVFGHEHELARGPSIRYSGEPYMPALSHGSPTIDWRMIDSDRHFRLPHGLYSLMGADVPSIHTGPAPAHRHFCNFIYSNGECAFRNAFFDLLHSRKRVDAIGDVRRNSRDAALESRSVADWPRSKRRVQSKYRFSVAFENSEHVGYTSEKLVDALLADTVPIYWGNPAVELDIPYESYISFYDHGSLRRLADHVLQVEAEPAEYNRIRAANPFRNGEMAQRLSQTKSNLREFIDQQAGDATRVGRRTAFIKHQRAAALRRLKSIV